jgi:hypothetical protein
MNRRGIVMRSKGEGWLVFLAVAMTLVAAEGCRGAATPAAEQAQDGVYAVDLAVATSPDLPRCTSELKGTTAYVASPPGLWACKSNVWVPIMCNTERAGEVAYASATRTLWACVSGQWTEIGLPDGGAPGTAGPQGDAGPAGPQGPQGPAGAQSLVSVSDESPGAHCAAGGVRIEVGVDTDGDQTLDADEINKTTYVCNGAPGSADAGAGGVDGGGAGPGSPGSPQTSTVELSPVEVQPGEDFFTCSYVPFTPASGCIEKLRHLHVSLAPGTVSLTLYRTRREMSSLNGRCGPSSPLDAGAVPVAVAQASETDILLPTGYVLRMPLTSPEGFVLEAHVVNTDSTPVSTAALVTLDTVCDTGHLTEAGFAIWTMPQIELPPQSITVVPAGYHDYPDNVRLLAIAAGTHQLGIEANVRLEDVSTGSSETVYQTDRPAAPAYITLEPPLAAATPRVLSLSCTFSNTTDSPVYFGASSRSEECRLFGYFGPSSVGQVCVTGTPCVSYGP